MRSGRRWFVGVEEPEIKARVSSRRGSTGGGRVVSTPARLDGAASASGGPSSTRGRGGGPGSGVQGRRRWGAD